MEYNCIFCKVLIDNSSIEHIIPSCIRGKLKSPRLICRKCNSQFGSEFDVVLKNRFEIIESFLILKENDRKRAKANLKYKNEDVLLTPEEIQFKHPKIISKKK